MPAAASGLPSIFLGEMPRPERKLPPVYLCETGPDGASCRLKWLASTCLAGMVGVCLIGVAIYASLNMGDGSGMMSSLKRASLAALQPMRSATLAKDGQAANGQKEDRIQMTAAGFVSRQVIHDTVIERQGSREFITIKPYLRIVAGLATELPSDCHRTSPLQSLQALFGPDAGRRRRRAPTTRRKRSASAWSTCRAGSCRSQTASSSARTRSISWSPRRRRISPMRRAPADSHRFDRRRRRDADESRLSSGRGTWRCPLAAYDGDPEIRRGRRRRGRERIRRRHVRGRREQDPDGRPRRHAAEPVHQGRHRALRGDRHHRGAVADLRRQGPEIRPGAPLHAGARAVRHRPDGADQGQRVRQGRATSPPSPATGRANMSPPGDAIGNDARRRRRRPAPRSTPASITRRWRSTFRPRPSSSCCASIPTTSTSSRRSRPATRSRCSSTAAATTRWANCSSPR